MDKLRTETSTLGQSEYGASEESSTLGQLEDRASEDTSTLGHLLQRTELMRRLQPWTIRLARQIWRTATVVERPQWMEIYQTKLQKWRDKIGFIGKDTSGLTGIG
jgi:hypothetical protein